MPHTVHVPPAIYGAIADFTLGAVLVRDLLPQVDDHVHIVETAGGCDTGATAIVAVTHVLGPVDLVHMVGGVTDVALVNFEVFELRNRPLQRTTLTFGADDDRPLVTV